MVEISTEGKTISCRAAVAWAVNDALKIEQIQVEPPKEGEVRIKITHSGVCGTERFLLRGGHARQKFPCIMGHEGAGIVESVGEGVKNVQKGDHVIPLYRPQCYECENCRNPKTNMCTKIQESQNESVMPDGTPRFSCNGEVIYHSLGCSTFSEYTVVSQYSVAKIDPKAPLENVCLIGCAISTGFGAAINTAKVEAGSTVAVWGLGAIGLAVVMGAKYMGAKRIIAIDINEEKFEKAEKFGATECINPKKVEKKLQEYLVEITDGGLDFTFECIGHTPSMRAALESCHKGWGVCCVLGATSMDQEVSTRPFQLVTGRKWTGSMFGGYKGRDSVPKLVEMYLKKEIKVDEFVTHRFPVDQITKAFDAMDAGKCLRCVVEF